MAGRDITEGRSGLLTNTSTDGLVLSNAYGAIGVGTGTIWQNTGNAYDVAIAGIPFLSAISDQRPYERATAPFRKQQFDSQRDPGEQSLTGWWLRSQSSFHTGAGINFYDPLANPYSTTIASNSYRIANSYGLDIWTPGQVTLLHDVTEGHNTLSLIDTTYKFPKQHLFSAKYNGTQGVILHDGYDLDRIAVDGTVEHWVDYNSGSADPVFAATTDGTTMYWVTNDAVNGKLRMEKKLTSASTSTSPTVMFTHPTGETVTRGTIGYVKQRIVLAANSKIYEFPITQATMPTARYTHPSSSYVYSSVSESGTAIYISGYEGIKSSIFKFELDTTTGEMPVLTSPITAAELPIGEIVHKIYGYLGYMVIGTNKGIRVASIAVDGSLTYGPLIVHTDQPVYDFCGRDTYIYATTGVGGRAGITRLDLGTEIDTLRFAYTNDLYYDSSSTSNVTTTVAFAGDTERIVFATTATSSQVGYTYIEKDGILRTSGYLDTGYIRYNTLELKNFKRLHAQGDFTYGSMSLETKDDLGNVYDVNSYDRAIGNPESTITQPFGAQDSLALRFVLYRDATTNTLGPVFKGYQLKAVPASPRQRIIKIPLMCYDMETDKYNGTIGYEGRAKERLLALEAAEANGDIVTWQDFRTGEIQQCLIEEVAFVDVTPPDKRLTGFGGIISLTIRTV